MFGSRPTLFLGGRSKHLDTSTRPAAGEGRQTGEAEPPHLTPPPTHTHRPRGPPAVRRGWCVCVGRRSTGQSSAEEPPAEPAVKRSAVARKTPQTNGRRRAIGGGGGGARGGGTGRSNRAGPPRHVAARAGRPAPATLVLAPTPPPLLRDRGPSGLAHPPALPVPPRLRSRLHPPPSARAGAPLRGVRRRGGAAGRGRSLPSAPSRSPLPPAAGGVRGGTGRDGKGRGCPGVVRPSRPGCGRDSRGARPKPPAAAPGGPGGRNARLWSNATPGSKPGFWGTFKTFRELVKCRGRSRITLCSSL